VTFFLWRRGPLLAAAAVCAAFLIAFAARGLGADEPARPPAAAESSPEQALAPVQRLEPVAVPGLRRDRNRRPAAAPTAAPTAETEVPVVTTPEPTAEPAPSASPPPPAPAAPAPAPAAPAPAPEPPPQTFDSEG
jgi:hypothetical protein